MDLFEAIHTQRAIRRLKPDPIPDSVIRQLLEAAICAPSGGNRQGWVFIVIRDPDVKARLAELYREGFQELLKIPYYRDAGSAPPDSAAGKMLASAHHLAEHLQEAPILILACLKTEGTTPGITMGSSIYPAVQNILLAARGLGIGSTLTTIHRFRDGQVKELLGVPAGVETAALIPLGYPFGKFGRPPRKPVSEVTYFDRWGRPPPW
ncbi:MAG: nitroreductase family protein [Candidatus Rokubacteria bacterium]|nr:nitroreductase family protein [Candidatus Rokubacteria bacterium]